MKNSILPAVLILYIALWSIGMAGSGISQKSASCKGIAKSESPTKIATGVSYIDSFLNLPYADGTMLSYGKSMTTYSLKLSKDIWTKTIKGPVVKEYKFIMNLGESLKIESLLQRTLDLTAKLCFRQMAYS